MNLSTDEHFPIWYIVNDSCIAMFSIITVLIGMTFVLLVLREKKLRTIINILSSNCCVCGSLLALTVIWDAIYMLKADISGLARQDRSCVTRNTCMLTAMIALNYSLCIQTYHRFVSIVHSQQSGLRSVSLYKKLIMIQWFSCPFLILPLILNKQIVYQPGSFVCQTSFSHKYGFSYLFIVSYAIPLIFIIVLHACIVHYLKKYWQSRRQQQRVGSNIVYPLQRIVIIILVLIFSYLPYGVFFIIEHLRSTAFPIAQRIAMICAAVSFASTMTFILGFNQAVRNSFCLIRHRRNKQVIKNIVYGLPTKLPLRVFV